jgi:2-dehydro-3-deoxy-D-arabinonate dehydratase
MKICRFQLGNSTVRIGLVEGESVTELTAAGVNRLQDLLEADDPRAAVRAALQRGPLSRLALAEVRLRAPVENQEVWAAGVTYLSSKRARMAESDFSATAYDRVYAADRPELFFKALATKSAGPGESVGIRGDARWSVPEPELALVLNSRGRVAACTLGNDMSSRDIESENLLYLPQAKIYDRSCALGPWLNLGTDEATARSWIISLAIQRGGQRVFFGEVALGQFKRSFAELAGYLFRSQSFPHGAVLLTGTGIVPPDDFTLQAGDEVEISAPAIGTLRNTVVVV